MSGAVVRDSVRDMYREGRGARRVYAKEKESVSVYLGSSSSIVWRFGDT
jgi:hypothetical protein